MLKKMLITLGIVFVLGIASYSLINKPLEVNTAVPEEDVQETLISKEKNAEISAMELVTEKIHEKYDTLKFVVKTSSKKEFTVQVQGNKEEFDSIKKDLESIAKNVIKSSSIKEYTVITEWIDLSAIEVKGAFVK